MHSQKITLHKRRFLWGLVCVAGLLLCLFLYVRLFSGIVRLRRVSPDGRTHAAIWVGDFAAATDVNPIAVTLRRKYDPFDVAVFGGRNYGANIDLVWQGNRDLLIICKGCRNLDVTEKIDHWKDISIHYDVDWVGPTY
jgi:hypothetical protein